MQSLINGPSRPTCTSRLPCFRTGNVYFLLLRTTPMCLFGSQTHGHRHYRQKIAKAHVNLYDVLEISPKATQSQIKSAYYKLSKVYHPDLNQGSKSTQERFAAISEAYSILGNVKLRRRYDRGIFTERDLHSEAREMSAREEESRKKSRPTRNYSVYYSKAGERMFDFDEFYRAHYGDALQREQRERRERKRRMEEWKREQESRKMPVWLMLSVSSGLCLAMTWFWKRLT